MQFVQALAIRMDQMLNDRAVQMSDEISFLIKKNSPVQQSVSGQYVFALVLYVIAMYAIQKKLNEQN